MTVSEVLPTSSRPPKISSAKGAISKALGRLLTDKGGISSASRAVRTSPMVTVPVSTGAFAAAGEGVPARVRLSGSPALRRGMEKPDEGLTTRDIPERQPAPDRETVVRFSDLEFGRDVPADLRPSLRGSRPLGKYPQGGFQGETRARLKAERQRRGQSQAAAGLNLTQSGNSDLGGNLFQASGGGVVPARDLRLERGTIPGNVGMLQQGFAPEELEFRHSLDVPAPGPAIPFQAEVKPQPFRGEGIAGVVEYPVGQRDVRAQLERALRPSRGIRLERDIGRSPGVPRSDRPRQEGHQETADRRDLLTPAFETRAISSAWARRRSARRPGRAPSRGGVFRDRRQPRGFCRPARRRFR